MNLQRITLLLLFLFSGTVCRGQGMAFEEELATANADYGRCYTVGNYKLCPEKKLILVGKMFGTATVDCFGYFPEQSAKYDEETMVIFAGNVFFEDPESNIDWQTVRLLSFNDNYTEFTDGRILYYFDYGGVKTSGRKYDKATYKPQIEKRLRFRGDNELSPGFSVWGKLLYYDTHPILERFNAANLRTIVSKNGIESNYMTDGELVIFGGEKNGYSYTTKHGVDYVVAEEWIIEGVDLPTLRVLGRDILCDKNALYYRENVIPFDKLNGFKFILREFADYQFIYDDQTVPNWLYGPSKNWFTQRGRTNLR